MILVHSSKCNCKLSLAKVGGRPDVISSDRAMMIVLFSLQQ